MSLVRLYGARDALDAKMMCDTLIEQGIDATVIGEMLGAARGDLPVTVETLPGVYVRDEDVKRALEIVREFERRGKELAMNPPAQWSCPKCGELNEGQFTQCWKCEADRPRLV